MNICIEDSLSAVDEVVRPNLPKLRGEVQHQFNVAVMLGYVETADRLAALLSSIKVLEAAIADLRHLAARA